MACIAGGIAQACYRKIPIEMIRETKRRLNEEFLGVIEEFENRIGFYLTQKQKMNFQQLLSFVKEFPK